MAADDKKKDDKAKKPPTPLQLREQAETVLRMARWTSGELTLAEVHERMTHVKADKPEDEFLFSDKSLLSDQFIFSEGYAVSTGAGLCITERGRLYMRMLDGL